MIGMLSKLPSGIRLPRTYQPRGQRCSHAWGWRLLLELIPVAWALRGTTMGERTAEIRDRLLRVAARRSGGLLKASPLARPRYSVRAGGFEPPRCFHQQDLNLPR